MKVKAIRKIHPMVFEEGRMRMNLWVLVNLDYMQFELPESAMAVLLDINHDIFEDADKLLQKLKGVEPDKTVRLNDAELYTLYLAYDLMGRLLASSFRERVMNGFHDGEMPNWPASTREKLYRFAIVNIAPIIKDSSTYARQHNCLKQLPEIIAKLKRMPVFD